MTKKKLIGWCIVSIPFLAIALYAVNLGGWVFAVRVFSLVAMIVWLIVLGCYLIVYSDYPD